MSHRYRGEGVYLPGSASTRLKWHKLRRHGAQAPFLRENLVRGLALGASMEVDLRLLACGNFVCLHDEHLDQETTGSGPVRALDADAISRLAMRTPDGTPTQSPPLLLSEVVALIAASPDVDGAARLQLDLQEQHTVLSAAVCDRFAATVNPVASRLLLSAFDWAAVQQLGGGIAGLGFGHDPSEQSRRWDFDEPGANQAFCRSIARQAPDAQMIYLYYRLVGSLLDAGFDIIAALHGLGFSIDCWTIDDGRPDATPALRQCLQLGVDQITTNTPIALEGIASKLAGTAGSP